VRRGRTVVMAALLALLVAGGARDALAAAPIGPGLLPPPPTVPAALRDLEARTAALQITSLEFKLTTRIKFGKRVPKGLASLLDFGLEGVETLAPPAAAIKMTLFGTLLRLRIVGSHAYLFNWPLGRRDGGRPWVELGKGALGKLLGGGGATARGGAKSGATRFTALLALLNDGRNLRALGPSTVDGQAVMGFEAEPQATSNARGEVGALTGFSAAKDRAKAKPKEKVILSIYFAPSGLPVRVGVLSSEGKVSLSLVADFPAINFTDTIPAPPPDHVITEAKLKKRLPPRRQK
jgi:hypothetical protein